MKVGIKNIDANQVQKTALITGTGGGIGKATAELLLKEGYFVFGYSRTNKINHPNFIFIPIDLSDLSQVNDLALPTINSDNVLFINNAATIGSIVPFDKKRTGDIINEYNLNLVSPTILCRKFITIYSEQEKLLINIGSGAANSPIPSWSTYCATKSALDMLTQVISEENHEKLRIFSVHPGIVDTNMQKTIRGTDEYLFPLLSTFTAYHSNNELETTTIAAQKLYYIIRNSNEFTKNILSIRDVNLK
ncbi:MAG: SDR family NAD(P)-dependent oxidoreductase [Flavobacteriales bacterium]|mgnify:CR=1 FL=1|nr:SDR family NAD(P)-dependent oxidoreductase [Flavobacteriales bacterium]MBT5750530.1 SDR family NAD(P)-dependent oxidoreductase [Flavobacteriales bacterium]